MLLSFLNFLGLDETSKINKITTQESKESIKEKSIPYKIELESIPLQKTTTKHITEVVGNTIIEKEVITTQTCNGESIQEKTQTNILSTQIFSKGI